ncbi:acyl carrier protein [Inquilinus sp.]|jgi:acyl carrier protein|uniref:acyl carrier protein n=1 Tax=Inquilinus sp. TaxID=1932117 RepID=UPI00378312E6
MSGRDRAEAEVLRVLRAASPAGRAVGPDDRLLEDLGLAPADVTRLAWDIEQALGADLPRDDLASVFTVRSLIDLVDQHYDPLTAEPKQGWHM